MTYKLSDLFEGNYKVSQKFGANPSYYSRFGLKGHEGVDFRTPVGVWCSVPFAKGQILQNGYSPIYGKYVVIWDPKQLCAVWYCHLSSVDVVPGQILQRGARVGKTGNTGNSTGPHLHVMFFLTDKYANRLHRNNGYVGGHNILDPKLVSWTLK